MTQFLEMERERRRGHLQGIGDRAHGSALRSGCDEMAKDVETGTLGKRGKGGKGSICFHVFMIMKTLYRCQAAESRVDETNDVLACHLASPLSVERLQTR